MPNAVVKLWLSSLAFWLALFARAFVPLKNTSLLTSCAPSVVDTSGSDRSDVAAPVTANKSNTSGWLKREQPRNVEFVFWLTQPVADETVPDPLDPTNDP